jgi:hypothetical protein
MMIGGIANISSAGFKEVLTIHINGNIMKADTPISRPYIKASDSQRESRRVCMLAS